MLRDYYTTTLRRLGGTVRTWCTKWQRIPVVSPTTDRTWLTAPRPSLHQLYTQAETALPAFVQASPVAMHYLKFLGPLDWEHFPEPPPPPQWYRQPEPRAHFAAAWLIKIAEQKQSMPQLRAFLVQNPALVWVLGFKLVADSTFLWGFDADAITSLQVGLHVT